MKMRWLGQLLATGTCAAALTLGGLTACGSANDSGAGSQAEEQPAAPADDSAQDQDGDGGQEMGEATGTSDQDATVPSSDLASGTVSVGDFTFEVPAYWAGRVEVQVFEDGMGRMAATIYLPGNPQAELAALSLVDGDEAMAAGDIGSHLVGSTASGQGTHVEVWTKNWPWLAANTDTASLGVSSDELEQFVDLSTGGALSLADAQAGGDDVVIAEADYTASELASTVAFG